MKKKMYIVRGSHDGNLGVYSNLKRAYDVALKYVKEDAEEGKCLISSYSKISKQFRDYKDYWSFCTDIVEDYWCTSNAEIEMMYLNYGKYGEDA